jgi:excisionase family DNA binding protein
LEAARYVGVSPTTFDKLVSDGKMPRPKEIGARRVYDRAQLDSAFDALGDLDFELAAANEWDA